MMLLHLALLALALPAVCSCAYLLFFTLLSARPPVPPRSSRRLRFDFIIPAHNEAAGLSRTLRSAAAIDWPAGGYRIVVVADNCTDDTAAIARAAGAVALERSDAKLRGKGYALAHAFAASRAEGFADAVVVVDADADVSANILEAFSARLERGANAVQAHYGVRNPHASWRTRLITIAKGSFHIVRSRARERLGLSCGVRGNGWCVTHALLERVPYNAYSPTEDIEYGIALGLAGERVAYADEAHADAVMESDEHRASSQRARWDLGRFYLIRAKVRPLLRAAAARPSAICLDLALDLLVLPLSYVAINSAGLIVLSAALGLLVPGMAAWTITGGLCVAALLIYVLRGWQLSGTGMGGLSALCAAPWFLAWKTVVAIRSRHQTGWVRTKRENE